MNRVIDRTEVNEIVKELKKVIKASVKEGKDITSVIQSDIVSNIVGDEFPCGTGDGDCTIYSFGLGKYDGRVTKANLDKGEVNDFGCKRIDVKDAVLEIVVYEDEDNNNMCKSIDIDLAVCVDWMDRYSNWHMNEYPTLKSWCIIKQEDVKNDSEL